MKQQPLKQKPKSNNFIYQRDRLRPGPVLLDNAQSPLVQHYRNIGNQGVLHLMETEGVQAKLEIGHPNDQYEQEADRVADQVMRMEEGSLVNGHWSLVQQEPTYTECEEVETPILTKAIPGIKSEVTTDVETSINELKGSGQPLSESTRAFFEPRFGVDFSNVLVHTDLTAAQTAQSINAQAFTLDNNIVFNSDQYAPETTTGKRLLAHELTHVVQQTSNSSLSKCEDYQSQKGPSLSNDTQKVSQIIQRDEITENGSGSSRGNRFRIDLDGVNDLLNLFDIAPILPNTPLNFGFEVHTDETGASIFIEQRF